MTYTELFRTIDDYFLTDRALARVRTFVSAQRQVEGWFKGELIFLFTSLQGEGHFNLWQSEYRTQEIGNGRIDFFITLSDGPLFVELKSFYHGQQAGANIDLNTCFTALPSDINKLSRLPNGNRFSLVFVTPRPEPNQWNIAIQNFRQQFPSIVEEHTQDEFPQEMYIAKLRVGLHGNGG